MSIQKEIESFSSFALYQASVSGDELTLDDLYQQWRAENPTPATRETDLQAVKAALLALEDGDRGTPAGELSAELRSRITDASR